MFLHRRSLMLFVIASLSSRYETEHELVLFQVCFQQDLVQLLQHGHDIRRCLSSKQG